MNILMIKWSKKALEDLQQTFIDKVPLLLMTLLCLLLLVLEPAIKTLAAYSQFKFPGRLL